MECPECGEELELIDTMYKGNYQAYENGSTNSWYEKTWDIFECSNEECDCRFFHQFNWWQLY